MKSGKIVFLEVPESLSEDIREFSAGQNDVAANFNVDPAIPLPVEIDDGPDASANQTSAAILAEKLSWEMILSGMIRVITSSADASVYAGSGPSPFEGVKPEWLDYYRHFILILKPEIYNEFSGAAVIKARNRDFDSALEIVTVLEALFPFSPEVLLNKALILEEEAADLEKKGCEMEAGLENDRALETYLKALDMDPAMPELLFNIGVFLTRRKEFTRAKEYLSEYVEQADDTEKKEKAQAIVKEIETQGLDDFKYLESIDLIRKGKEDEALLLIRDFIEEHPKVWNAWFVLGWALRKQGRFENALGAFRKALELGGGTPDTRNETAICLMELGDFAGARKELEAALREEPENVKIISNLGMLALKKGDSEEAAAFFRIVLELNPQDPLALKFLGRPTPDSPMGDTRQPGNAC